MQRKRTHLIYKHVCEYDVCNIPVANCLFSMPYNYPINIIIFGSFSNLASILVQGAKTETNFIFIKLVSIDIPLENLFVFIYISFFVFFFCPK